MRNIERRNIDEPMVDARIYARGEWESTGEQWFLVALYDMDYKLDLSRPTRG